MATLNLSAPRSWGELSQGQLEFLLRLLSTVGGIDAGSSAVHQVAIYCLMKWNGISAMHPIGNGWLLRSGSLEGFVPVESLAAAAMELGWVGELPGQPVRVDTIGNCRAAAADLDDGTSFDTWLSCETLWQQYRLSSSNALLGKMASMLYKGSVGHEEWQLLGVFYWWAGVKALCNELYPHFFRPATDSSTVSNDTLRRGIDTQIRALTKGDITKEEKVLAMPCHRALTELDALAREYEELNEKYTKK